MTCPHFFGVRKVTYVLVVPCSVVLFWGSGMQWFCKDYDLWAFVVFYHPSNAQEHIPQIKQLLDAANLLLYVRPLSAGQSGAFFGRFGSELLPFQQSPTT